ncbi:MAG TPA: translocation/assembly module TamB domain-containing protein, partial [Gemmatimonadaceae bacterium]|nr:translocation/assembly module TamB domain-containing protein [Gemmatimonadaceae bacterium]
LHGTNLRFTRFSTDLVERLVPGLDVRVPGAFTGRAVLAGPRDAVRVDVDGTFDPSRHPPFQVAARGRLGTGEAVYVENLRLTAEAVPVSLARDFAPDLPIGGTVSVDAIVNGSTAGRLTGRAGITHREGRAISTLIAEGEVAPNDSMRMRVDLRLAPLSLEIAQHFAPKVDFVGEVAGRGEVRGTPRHLGATLALALPAGAVEAEGTLDLRSETPAYQATLRLRGIDVSAMAPQLPMTALNGGATVSGRGFDPATMNTRLRMNLRDVVVDSAQVAEAVIVADTRDARLTVDTLRIRAPFATAVASGTFGLAAGAEGTLTYRVDVSTLAGLQRWIETGDTTLVYPRPLARQRAIAQSARADSIRRAALVETVDIDSLVAHGEPWLRRQGAVRFEERAPLARDSIAGTVSLRGSLKGGIKRFTAEGRAGLSTLIWGGNEIGRGTVEARWENVGTPEARVIAEMGVDSVRAAGFAFDSTHVQATYRSGNGGVVLAIYPGDTAAYRVRAEYALRTGEGELRLQDVSLRFDSVTWISTRPSTIRWRGHGVAIDSLELRPRDEPGSGRDAGRIFVNGEMPDRDPGRLEVHVDSLRIAPWLTLLQSTLPLDGLTSLHAELSGTRSAPRIRGELSLEQHVYNEVPFPELHADFGYEERRFRFEGDLRRAASGRPQLMRLTGDVPLDLSLGDSVANRLIGGPITIDLEGDSIPLGPLAELVDALSVVDGAARGRVGVRGSWERPRFVGSMAVDMPQVGLRPLGVTLTNTTARLRMTGDRVVIDTLVSYSGGTIRGSGSVLLADIERPVFDLRLAADEARVLNNPVGELVVSSRLGLEGPLDTLSVGGTVTVMNGVIRIPEPEDQKLINTGDPALFAVVDTAVARELDVAPPSRLFENALVDVQLEVRRGTWARSPDANLEVFGELSIERDRDDEEIGVSGSLHTDYGDYTMYGRRFTITRGSVRFTGPPANPVLQVLAIHQVRQSGRAPFDIQVTIGGTLEQPNISLDSQAQPTLSQSDLIAFLAFGRSSSSLLQFEGSGIEGGGLSGSSLAGNVAALATRQLAGVALGALVDEVESDLVELTAADVLNIRPAELPPGLSIGAVGTLLRGTQFEVGKYLDRDTFFVITFRPTLVVPGAILERRFGSQFRLRTMLETRFPPQRPSLTTGLQAQSVQVLGALLFWTRGW